MFAKQFYWSKLSRVFFKLGRSRAFQLSPDRFPSSYWAHIDWLILPFQGKLKLRSRLPVMVLALAASQRHCFGKGPQRAPFLLQVTIHFSFSHTLD